MGCEPSSELTVHNSQASSENQEFVVNYRQFVANDRGDVCEFYHFSKIISRSATSIVRKVIHRQSKMQRVCKIVPLTKKECISAMREVETLRQLDHPNIVHINEYFLEDAYLYIIMEEIPGKSLINEIVSNGGIKLVEIVSVMRQLLSATDYMHQQGFCHRIINPDNVLLVKTEEGFIVKIIDFSQACANDCPVPPIIPRSKKNSAFQSPQQEIAFKSNSELQKRDIWGCALILYSLISERPARDFYMEKDNLLAELKQANKSPLGIRLLERMITNNPKERPSVSECLEDEFFKSKREEDMDKKNFMFSNLIKFNAENKLKTLLWMYASLNMSNFQEKSQYLLEFHNLDKNRDGTLDFEEIAEGIQNTFNIGRQKAEEHASEIFKSLDKNNNGCLDYSQFLMGTMAVSKVISESSLKRMFNQLDTNNDGSITEEELNNLIDGFSNFKFLGHKNKTISFAEFKKLMTELASSHEELQ